jgi:hypothetical protein
MAVASDVRQGMPKLIGVSEVMDSNGAINAAARERIRSSDDQYLQTSPGQRFFVQFNVGSPSPGMSRTFLLSSQGYYIEWIRGSWIQKASAANPFIPDDDALLSALHKWGSVRDSFEKEFMNARVPVH